MSVVILARVTASDTNQGPAAAPTPALKEWAAIVHALLEGEQIVDVRKGGLHEDGRHFGVAGHGAAGSRRPPSTKRPSCSSPRTRTGSISPTPSPVGAPDHAARLGRHRRRRDDHRARAPRRARLQARLGPRLRRVALRMEAPRSALGARAARAPARDPAHRRVERHLRGLHVVGRLRRAARRSRVASVRGRALRRRVRGQAQGHPRGAARGVLEPMPTALSRRGARRRRGSIGAGGSRGCAPRRASAVRSR